MTRKVAAKLQNKKTGFVYALVNNGDGTFSVLKRWENYDGKVRSGISYRWTEPCKSVSKAQAREYFYEKVGPQG